MQSNPIWLHPEVWNPIVLLTAVLILSVIALIAAAVLGWDKGVLKNMGRRDYARGLITYLFAVVTIGTAAILALSALIYTPPVGGIQEHADRSNFENAKEIFSMLVGIFGAIIGYYFGADHNQGPIGAELSVSTLHVDGSDAGRKVLRAVVQGGTPPYHYGVGIDRDEDTVDDVPGDGWVVHEVEADSPKSIVRLTVQDSAGAIVRRSSRLSHR